MFNMVPFERIAAPNGDPTFQSWNMSAYEFDIVVFEIMAAPNRDTQNFKLGICMFICSISSYLK